MTQSMRIVSAALLLIAIGLLAFVPACPADDGGSKPKPAAKTDSGKSGAFLDRFKAAVDSVKLTEDQKQKADAFFESARLELKSLGTKANTPALKKQVTDVFDKLRKDIASLLTDEQRTEIQRKLQPAPAFVAMIEKIKQQLGSAELKLTPEQKDKAFAILDDTRNRLEELHAEAQAGATDGKEKAALVIKDMRAKLSAVLNPGEKGDKETK